MLEEQSRAPARAASQAWLHRTLEEIVSQVTICMLRNDVREAVALNR